MGWRELLGQPAWPRGERRSRKLAHEAVDSLWKSGAMSKAHAYVWVSQVLRITAQEAHMSEMDNDRCKEVRIRAVELWCIAASIHGRVQP